MIEIILIDENMVCVRDKESQLENINISTAKIFCNLRIAIEFIW